MNSILIPVGGRVPRRGGHLLSWLGWLVLRVSGWRVSGDLPDVSRAVVIVAPHTSNWDGLFGLSAVLALKLRVNVLGKHSLFVGPLGWLLRHLGVIPLDRRAPQGTVRHLVERFEREERFFLGVAPEGTRHAATRWKTGFYQVAREAGVPIILAALDYARREARILGTLEPGADREADMARIYQAYRSIRPRKPERLSQPLR